MTETTAEFDAKLEAKIAWIVKMSPDALRHPLTEEAYVNVITCIIEGLVKTHPDIAELITLAKDTYYLELKVEFVYMRLSNPNMDGDRFIARFFEGPIDEYIRMLPAKDRVAILDKYKTKQEPKDEDSTDVEKR